MALAVTPPSFNLPLGPLLAPDRGLEKRFIMSSNPHHRHARRRLDELVRTGYHSLLLSTSSSRRMYTRLLHWVRVRSNLLQPIGDSALLERVVGALAALARYHRRFERMPEDWKGGQGNVYELVQSLAEHLLGNYPVPRCLAKVWMEPPFSSKAAKQAREWFIAHAQGKRFRAIADLPMVMTRKMERLLLSSPHHLSIRGAMRRAELLALGAKPHLIAAVMDSELRETLEHGAFWRECFHWLIRHQDQLEGEEIAEIIEFVEHQRFSPMQVWTPGGLVDIPPPNPEFRLAGRSLASLDRLMRERDHDLLLLRRGALGWRPSGLAGLLFGDLQPEVEWKLVELLDSRELVREGRVLRHCVGMYANDCRIGRSSIWSLRRRDGPGARFISCFTIEVNLSQRKIVQMRGRFNNDPPPRPREMVARWAQQLGLALAI